MPRQFPDNKYLIQVVQPINQHGRVEPLRIDIYEMLETNKPTEYNPNQDNLKHIRFVDSIMALDRFGHNPLSLDEITEKIYEIKRVD